MDLQTSCTDFFEVVTVVKGGRAFTNQRKHQLQITLKKVSNIKGQFLFILFCFVVVSELAPLIETLFQGTWLTYSVLKLVANHVLTVLIYIPTPCYYTKETSPYKRTRTEQKVQGQSTLDISCCGKSK